MIEIYICDDEDVIRENIEQIIANRIIIEDYDMRIKCSVEVPADLIAHLEESNQRRNLYFLDVELNCQDYDGFLLGKKIRSLDPHGTIVYITSYKDLAYKTTKGEGRGLGLSSYRKLIDKYSNVSSQTVIQEGRLIQELQIEVK